MFLLIKETPHLLKHFELVSLLSQNFLVIKHLHNELNSPGNVIWQLPFQLFKISLRAKAIRPFINLIPFCSCSSWLGNVTTRSKGQRGMRRKLYKTLIKFPGPRPHPQHAEASSCWHTTHTKWPFSCVHKHLSSQKTSTLKGNVGMSKSTRTQTTGWEPVPAWKAEN